MLIALLLAVAPPQADAGPVCDASWHDAARNRDVPVRIRMPAGAGKAPVILFSHGLGGSLAAGTIWAEAWAREGFIVIHLQHAGSDGPAVRAVGFQKAMGADQLIARAGDVHFALDTVAHHPKEGACDLARADMAHVGMSGHSFGAHTTLAVSGQRYAGGRTLTDPRITASIAFSPAPPNAGGVSDAEAFGGIRIPFYSLTGSLDAVPITPTTPADRQRPYRAMPAGDKYLLVLEGANHAAFGGQNFGSHGTAPDSHVQPIVVRTTTLFWRWTLMGDAIAKAELDATPSTLGPGDSFERH